MGAFKKQSWVEVYRVRCRIPKIMKVFNRKLGGGVKLSFWSMTLMVLICLVLAESSRVRGAQQTPVPERILVSNSRSSLGTQVNLSASVRVGDFNADGNLDVAVANGRHWPQQNFIFLNQGNARFNQVWLLGTNQSTSYASEIADMDGDGDLDVVVGNDMAPNLLFLNKGRAEFEKGIPFGNVSSVRSLTLSDLDSDGDVDVLVTCRGRQNYYCLNDGKANLGTPHPFGEQNDSTIDVVVADLNRDGFNDLILANRDKQQNFVLLSDGKLGFDQKIPFGSGKDETRSVAVGDLNGDGHLDLALANIGEPNQILFGDGKGGFGDSKLLSDSRNSSYAVALADMNQDQIPDLVFANAGQLNAMYLNQGDGTSYAVSKFGLPEGRTYGLVVADFNGDAYPDVLTANSDALNWVYLNRANLRDHK